MLSLCTRQLRASARPSSLLCTSIHPTPSSPSSHSAAAAAEIEQFQPLDIGRRKELVKKTRGFRTVEVPPSRAESQSVTQRWGDVWPAARTYHPAAVPLPLRQGYVDNPAEHTPPGKYANAELMKISNFLHLTPPAVERHCLALRNFCTKWPEGLDDEKLDRLQPLEVITQDFVHATPSVRHPDSRVVSIRLPLSQLQLSERQRDKLLRLVGERYCEETETLTITADRCPYRRQNYDYANYLLTVLYFESCKREPWEEERETADAELFLFRGSASEAAVARLGVEDGETVEKYGEAVAELHNLGEDEHTLTEYRKAAVRLLNLPEHVGAD